MVLVTSCQGWEVTTVEGAGGRLAGYSKLQTTLADHNGTQCGYCTPGWVMAMHRYSYSYYTTVSFNFVGYSKLLSTVCLNEDRIQKFNFPACFKVEKT